MSKYMCPQCRSKKELFEVCSDEATVTAGLTCDADGRLSVNYEDANIELNSNRYRCGYCHTSVLSPLQFTCADCNSKITGGFPLFRICCLETMLKELHAE